MRDNSESNRIVNEYIDTVTNPDGGDLRVVVQCFENYVVRNDNAGEFYTKITIYDGDVVWGSSYLKNAITPENAPALMAEIEAKVTQYKD